MNLKNLFLYTVLSKRKIFNRLIGSTLTITITLSLHVCLFGFYGISTFVGLFNDKSFLYKWTVLIQVIQFSISTQFSSIWPIDRTLSGAITPAQGGPGSDGNEGVLRNPQSSSIIGTSPLDCLVSYPGHLLGEVLPLCRVAFDVFYISNWLGKSLNGSANYVVFHIPQGLRTGASPLDSV